MDFQKILVPKEGIMKIKKILVPVDFSEYSQKALEYALLWGDTFEADLTLLHVNTLFHKHFQYEALAEKYLDIIEKQEEHIHQWFKDHAIQTKLKEGSTDFKIQRGKSAAHEILKYISGHHFDLVVMGTHGRTGSKHLLLGSVAEKVSRLSPAPVLTTHIGVEKYGIQNILVPVELADFSKTLIEKAITLAKAFSAQIHLLHVIERGAPPDTFEWVIGEMREKLQFDPEIKERVQNTLRYYLSDFDYQDNIFKIVKIGDPSREIVLYAQDNDIDLVLMATRGFSKFEYFWSWGSVTERVVRLASCPVLAIRQNILQETPELLFEND
jgi:nucleotide-binding universal stress UspA family protein